MARRSLGHRTGIALLLAAVALAAVLPLTGLGAGLLFVAPAIVAMLALAAGWFPGEDVLVAALDRGRPRRFRAPLVVSGRRPSGVLRYARHPVAGCAAGRAPPLTA